MATSDDYDCVGKFLRTFTIINEDGKTESATVVLPDGSRIKIQAFQQISEVLTQHNVKLVFIGNSTAEQMNEYIKSMEEPPIGQLYTDPTLNFHKLFQLKRGIFRSVFMPLFTGLKKYGFGGIIEGARLGAEKYHLAGDSWQQGGLVILDAESRVIYKHQEEHPADWPDMKDVLPLVGINDKSVEYETAVSDWLEVRRRNRQQTDK